MPEHQDTYDFIVYICVIHLKRHVEFEVVPQYSSDDICGHVISVISKIFVTKSKQEATYLACPICASAYLLLSGYLVSRTLVRLTSSVRNCTTKPSWPSSQWGQKEPSIL